MYLLVGGIQAITSTAPGHTPKGGTIPVDTAWMRKEAGAAIPSRGAPFRPLGPHPRLKLMLPQNPMVDPNLLSETINDIPWAFGAPKGSNPRLRCQRWAVQH